MGETKQIQTTEDSSYDCNCSQVSVKILRAYLKKIYNGITLSSLTGDIIKFYGTNILDYSFLFVDNAIDSNFYYQGMWLLPIITGNNIGYIL